MGHGGGQSLFHVGAVDVGGGGEAEVLEAAALEGHAGHDEVLVQRLTSPSTARLGESVDVSGDVTSSVAQPATVRLFVNGELAGTRPVDLEAGTTRVTFNFTPKDSGFLRFRMVVEAARDTFNQNDRAEANTIVKGEPKVLVVKGDETVAADESRSVHPYRKPLSVVRKDLPKEQVAPVDAGLLPVPAVPLRLSGLVLIDRDPELGAPQLSTVPLAEALPELVTQMSYLRDHPAPLQSIARLCDAVGGVRMLRYPDAETVPEIMPEILSAEPAASEWHPLALPAVSGPYGVAQARDAIRSDDYLIVMVESELKVLDGIAPVIWQAAADGADLGGIIAAVVDAHGEPPTGSARQIVEDAVDELVVAGVLSRD